MINQTVAAIDKQTSRVYQLEQLNATLLAALKELVRCVRGGDETSGVTMDDALVDADEALSEAKARGRQ